MSTKKTTTQTNQYDPTSMSAFQKMQPGIADYVTNLLAGAASPTKSNIFQGMYQASNKQALNLGLRDIQNLMLNAPQFRVGNMGAYQASQLGRAGRFTQAMQGNAYLNSLNGFNGLVANAANIGASYRPLQTGSTQVQQTSGLGSWLPQVAGMGLMAAMPFLAPAAAPAAAAGTAASTAGGAALSSGSFFNQGNPFTANSNPFIFKG